jgi:MoaA/NifB/PqqE/SkfB family radical SAM enzyme
MKIDGIRKTLHQVNRIPYDRPVMFAKMARGYFRALVLRKPSLSICEFSINTACQSSCEFCYAARFARPDQEMLSVDEILSTWEQAKALGAFQSFILGGEPLLHPQFFDILAILEPKKHAVSFSTNALLLTDEVAREIKRMGIFTVLVSLNSMDPKLNDKLRGYDGHFDAVMKAVEHCKKHKIDASLTVATAKPLLKETMDIVAFANQHKLGITVNLMCPMGRAEHDTEDLFDEEFWATLRQMYDSNPRMRSDFDVNMDLKVGCPAGFEKVHVGPYGHVTGCSMNPSSFGNIREEPLADIVARMRQFRHFAKRSPHCLVAVDQEFIDDYMGYAQNYDVAPYPIQENPRYNEDRVYQAVTRQPSLDRSDR